MKRLREEVDSPDPRLAAAGRLVGQVAPLTPSEVRARRVRRALDASPRRGFPSRPVILIAVLFGMVGSAAAAWGVSAWVKPDSADPRLDVPREEDGADSKTVDAPERPVSGGGVADQEGHSSREQGASKDGGAAEKGATGESQEGEGAAAPGPEGPSSRRASSVSPDLARSVKQAQDSRTQRSVSKTEPAAAPTLSEARLVKEAVEALRGGGDPERAGELLSEYRKKSSSGHLDEEALALAIEVALAQKSPDAAKHASTYLRKYPGGKFTSLAQRALKQH